MTKIYKIEQTVSYMKPKQRKKIMLKYNLLMDTEKTTKTDYAKFTYNKQQSIEEEKLQTEYNKMETWVHDNCCFQIKIMIDNGFIVENEGQLTLTNRGKYATCLQEVFSLPFAEAIDNDVFKNITPKILVSVLSCFTNLKLSDENSVYSIKHLNETEQIIAQIERLYNKYTDIHNINKLTLVETHDFHLNLAELTLKWCDANDELECKQILKECIKYDISLGDFVKAILKINNIANELEKAATIKEDLELLHKLTLVQDLTLKYCVSNQSLYL